MYPLDYGEGKKNIRPQAIMTQSNQQADEVHS